MNYSNRYINILNAICNYYGINENEFINILSNKDAKYLYLLFISKYNCLDKQKVRMLLNVKNNSSISYNLKKAEQKLLISQNFREKYFDIEKDLLKFL